MQIDIYKEKIIDVLKDFECTVIYVFGSAARNELRKESDLDIAFLTDKNIDEYECFMKGQEVASLINRDIDLINLKNASTVFKAQIIGNGIIIYCSDNVKRAYFEMRSLKEYTLLNEERKVILDKIKESGTVYGK